MLRLTDGTHAYRRLLTVGRVRPRMVRERTETRGQPPATPVDVPAGCRRRRVETPCASNQMTPSSRPRGLTDDGPMPIEWSPPRTSGNRPSRRARRPPSSRPQDLFCLSEELRAPTVQTTGIGVALLRVRHSDVAAVDAVDTNIRQLVGEAAVPFADGPMSTPRRSAPRSIGTPRTRTCS